MEFTHSSHDSGHAADRHPPASLATDDVAADGDDDGSFDLWFLELSNFYNLNLRRPNSSFSAGQTDPTSYCDDSSFYSRLKTQYLRGNSDKIAVDFDRSARVIHNRWVNKPKGEYALIPSFTSLPRASTEPERASMLESLAEILDSFTPGGPFRRTHHSKRPSQGEGSKHSASSTRPKHAAAASSGPPSVLSRLDSGEVRASTPLLEPLVPPVQSPMVYNRQHDVGRLGPSVHTSTSSPMCRVLSRPEDSEVTVAAPNRHRKRKLSSLSGINSVAPSDRERVMVAPIEECSDTQQNAGPSPTQSTHTVDSSQDSSLGSGDMDFEWHDSPAAPPGHVSPKRPRDKAAPDAASFAQRLRDVWPALPARFQSAPLAVRWEIMRVALHCGLDMDDLRFEYHPDLNDQARLWDQLYSLGALKGKKVLPDKSKPEVWKAAMTDSFRSTDQVIVLAAGLVINSTQSGPLFKLELQPLRLDLPHRLDRRFGSDRFLELVIPSLYTRDIKNLSKGNESVIIDSIHNWLVKDSHTLLGRRWKSFCTKSATPKKLHKDDTLKPETVIVLQDRVYLFAEGGADFLHGTAAPSLSPKFEPINSHTAMTRQQLLNWLLQIEQNKKSQKQSVFKLFSRISLGLSRTCPAVVLEPQQIRHRDADVLSPAGKVMNDGIARMSTALARRVRDAMGLDEVPAGFQGRLGSAKGFWIRDTEDSGDEIWIETYPSQVKWACDFKEEDHRTFEVRSASRRLKPAALNLQLLPILEDRAIDAPRMKKRVGELMAESLTADMKTQKEAMQDPAHFKLWVHTSTTGQRRQDRVRLGHLPWNAGLPSSREDQMEFLLSQGFDPQKLEFLRKIAFGLRKEKCEELQSRLNIRVGRSTYAYMVVDFSGVLEEDEVHLGFSSRFADEHSGFSETFLHGMDVLVARTPAHYPSDIQRVKAVFKPELGSLKDVIIFPTKGSIPLADKLSGGDYDGDIAWVCWEPSIVSNFTNAPLPDAPDLFGSCVLTKKTGTYEDLAQSCAPDEVTTEFIDQAFRFNMEPNLLGTCTNYKEKLCYSRNSVRDEHAIFMSTLIAHLVDRAKQGIVFSEKDWDRERKILNTRQQNAMRAKQRMDPPPPQYKSNNWGGGELPTHIIDFVKFVVGKPTVECELRNLDRHLHQAYRFDRDLVGLFQYYERFRRPHDMKKRDEAAGIVKSTTWETVLDALKTDIDAVAADWINSRGNFDAKLSNAYEKWCKIAPTDKVRSKTVLALCEDSLAAVGLSQWDLLKASYCFKMYYNRFPTFPWYMAGYQLAFLKSIAVSKGSAPPVLMTPEMYAGTRPDGKFVRAIAALREGRRVMEDFEL